MNFYSKIIGTGSYLPPKVLTNKDLEEIVNTSDEWITTRTGIKERHIVEDQATSDLATEASKNALEMAGISPEELDGIILATTTPDNTFPATAAKIQSNLGATKDTFAFDMQAVCSGFIFALMTADSMIKSGRAKNILVIGADSLSKIIDWKDRNTCVLFGDGAGAVILQAQETETREEADKNGVLSTEIRTDGSLYNVLKTSGGIHDQTQKNFMLMDGPAVFKTAVTRMPKISIQAIEKAGLEKEDIDFFIPHQANIRIIDAALKRLGLPKEKTIVTVDKHANTSAASVPLALDKAVRERKINDGDNVLMSAMGGGFTWGSLVIKF
ncbi:MAG: ketoacyl-ACP synthase III [Alphaproteobacteria bacterium]|jgi:3-oxoacyl-[acyl-carrier-protein] synthase-3|nr:ketoacyl-ACP synthase III [Alphaproteobacteria bacterium]